MNPLYLRTILLLFVIIVLSSGCTTIPESPENHQKLTVKGLYIANSTQTIWLAITHENRYVLCNLYSCYHEAVETVAVESGAILLNFFKSEIAQTLEYQSFGRTHDTTFLETMKNIRLTEHRPYDLAFNLTYCNALPCASFGHVRKGIRFYKVSNWLTVPNSFKQKPLTPN